MGDQALKSDVLDNLVLAATELANPSVRSICSGRGFEDALATENRFAEKMSLFHLGLAYSAMRELASSAGLRHRMGKESRKFISSWTLAEEAKIVTSTWGRVLG